MIDLEVSVDASLRHSRGVLFFWWRNPPFFKGQVPDLAQTCDYFPISITLLSSLLYYKVCFKKHFRA